MENQDFFIVVHMDTIGPIKKAGLQKRNRCLIFEEGV